jgi:hypothetical protein
MALTNDVIFLESIVNILANHVDIVDGVFWYTKMFITLWFGFDYGTNPPLGTLII